MLKSKGNKLFYNINTVFLLFYFRLTAAIEFKTMTKIIKHFKAPAPMAVVFLAWLHSAEEK